MKTLKEKLNNALETNNLDNDSVEKLIAYAYYKGYENATKTVSDKYTDLIQEMRNRADTCRYHNLAHTIIGDTNYVYFSEYSQPFSELDNDKTIF